MRRLPRVMLALLVAASALAPNAARTAAANPDRVAAGAQELATRNGGQPSDYELVYERTGQLPDGAGAVWSGKYVDRRSGEVWTVQDASGGVVAGATIFADRAAEVLRQLPPLERKADAALLGAVAAAEPERSLPVALWLSVDVTAAEQAVAAAHPELTWEGDRPLVDDVATARAIRAELWEARRAAYAAAQDQLRVQIEVQGGTVAYASTSAPLVFADVPARGVGPLADLPAVASLGLEQAWRDTMSSANPAVEGNWTGDGGDQGNGVRVAVVEYHNVRPGGDMGANVVASYSTSGTLAYAGGFDHPTWVAGAIASVNGGYPGVAPGADIVSAGTGGYTPSLTYDRAIIAATDWAVSPSGGDADIVSASIAQDTATGAEEARRYFDSVVAEDSRLVVAAAGNYSTFGSWDVTSPGTGYNVLTVGGTDDRGTPQRSDDRVWYGASAGSAYRDRTGTPWNAFGDFNKPNVAAPAVGVRTANGLAADGTSVATPIVSGIAAQLFARYPTLLLRPEAARALIMAGAVRHSELPDGSVNADHEGVGSASAYWANRIVNVGDGPHGGHQLGTMTAGSVVRQQISVVAGQLVRVVLTWNSHTGGDNLAKSDRLMADLDLRVVQPNGAAVGSFSFDNNYEWVEFVANQTGTVTIEVPHDRFEAASERYAIAWTKRNIGTSVRFAGSDRYATAATVSAATFAPGVPAVYIATGENYPDALAGGPAARVAGGPVLLVTANGIPGATAAELQRLRPGRIIVLGGPNAVSDGVVAALRGYTSGDVTRRAGDDRYATAAAVSHTTFAAGVPVAYVATGAGFPDALSGAALAARDGGPILLVRAGEVPGATAAELSRLRPGRIVILGGPGVVGDGVAAELNRYTAGGVTRIWGADRYDTSAAISRVFPAGRHFVFVASGERFPDALAAAPAAGRSGVPVLLVRSNRLPASVAAELRRIDPSQIIFVGGPAAVSDGVRAAIQALWD